MRQISAWVLSVALLAGLVACSQPTPEERVAEMRGRYHAELKNHIARQTPLVDPALEEGMEEGMGVDADAAEGEEMVEEEVLTRTDILLDILIRNENRENLPGLTLEVAHLGAGDGGEGATEMTWADISSSPDLKNTWHIYVDTSTIGRGPGTSLTHLIEDVQGYQPADRFAVSVRHPVPPGDRGDYREFAEAE